MEILQALHVLYSNVTIIGPLLSPTSTAYDPQYISAVHVRRGSALSMMNSVINVIPQEFYLTNQQVLLVQQQEIYKYWVQQVIPFLNLEITS